METVVRQDIYLYNEANGWVITSGSLNGVAGGIGVGEEWEREFARGTFLPLELVQDDSLIVRVVVNDALNDAETAEWVDRCAWKLAVPDGRLVLSAGIEYLEDPEEFDQDYVRTLDIPPGDYRIEVFTYLNSVNGPDKPGNETLKRYWRRTRKGEKLPLWILAREDDEYEDADEDLHLVGFLVHLTPFTGDPVRPPLAEGWIPVQVAPRKPDRCPRGIPAENILGMEEGGPEPQTGLYYTHAVPELVAGLTAEPIHGGPVQIAVRDLVLPYWLAWFCGESHPCLLIRGAPGAAIAWPTFEEGIHATPTRDGWRVDIEGSNARWSQFGHLKALAPLLETLPDGAELELATADNEATEPYGFHRYQGTVTGGEWRLERTYPPVERATLEAMLALARETEAGDGITTRDEAELARILDDCRERDQALSDHRPRKRGKRLTFNKADVHWLPFLGARFYVARFGSVWPMMDRDDTEEVQEWEQVMDVVAEAGARWTVGEEVVYAGSFASYTRTDLARANVVEAGALADAHRGMEAAGFTLLGDLHSTQTFGVVFRGYGRPDSAIYGACICPGLGTLNVDFFTPFADGWTLTTSRVAGRNHLATDRKRRT